VTLIDRFRPVIDRIAAGLHQHEADRTLPYDEVRALADAGFGALRVPTSEGGSGVSLASYFELLVEVAAADSNQPQIWRNHIAFVEDRLQPTADDRNLRWRKELASGAVIGGAWSERSGSFKDSKTRLEPDGDGWRLDGEKYYSTGSIYADWISVAVRRDNGADEEPEHLVAIVDAHADGVEVVDDWTGFGQRLTGSGTARFNNVRVPDEDTFSFAERSPYQEAVYQLVHVATLAGIARAAQRDVVASLQTRTRAYPNGLSDVPRDDAQLQAVVGSVAALASSAEASVVRAASILDIAADLAIAGESDQSVVDEAVNRAAVAVYEAQTTVTRDALEASTRLFDAIGSSAVDTSTRLDRHWRNARTVTSHNPRVYKERQVGAWYLNGTPPVAYDLDAQKTSADSTAVSA
jgi:alkylation response protein AidB-like acyl-CoA dehydrogenase